MQGIFIQYDVAWRWMCAIIAISFIFYIIILIIDYLKKDDGTGKYILSELKIVFRTLFLSFFIALIILYITFISTYARYINPEHNFANGAKFNLFLVGKSISN